MLAADSVIRLRPHHFLCILTYIGKGYSQAFIRNFDAIITQLNAGKEPVLVHKGADDVCAPRLMCTENPEHHCHDAEMLARDQQALEDLRDLGRQSGVAALQNIDYGHRILLDSALIETLRQAFQKNAIRTACQNCQWHGLCSDVSGNKYQNVRLEING